MKTTVNSLLDIADYEQCCTRFYEDDLLTFFLGESYHPGGVELTKELGSIVGLNPHTKVLDLACGKGTSALVLSREFGCQVVGIDLSSKNVAIANQKAFQFDLTAKLSFQVANAQKLPFPNESFDAIISECSFCIFTEKNTVIQEVYRVLKPGGSVGFSDITLEKKLPYEMKEMIYRVACISDAQSSRQYLHLLKINNFNSLTVQDKSDAITDLYKSLKKKLFALQIAKNLKRKELKNIDLRTVDFKQVNKYVDKIKEFVEFGYGSYVIITGKKI